MGEQVVLDDGFDIAALSIGKTLRLDGWRAHLEHRLRNEGMPAALEAHLGKFRSLMPALALL